MIFAKKGVDFKMFQTDFSCIYPYYIFCANLNQIGPVGFALVWGPHNNSNQLYCIKISFKGSGTSKIGYLR